MIEIDIATITNWLHAFFLPFTRIVALIGAAPFFGESSVPMRLKVSYAILITLIVGPTVEIPTDVAFGSYTSFLLIVQQTIIGIALGLVLRIVFAIVITAGEFVGLQMGLSFASFFDPATGSNTAVLSRIMNVMTLLLFIAMDGHLMLIRALVNSFYIMPISADIGLNPNGWGAMFEYSSQIMESGLQLALPLMIILLTITLSLGILNRTAQQLSIFAVGFPISLLTGFVLLVVVLPQTGPFIENLFNDSFEAMARMLQGLRGD